MEIKPDKKDKNKIYTFTIRFNKAQYMALNDAFWKTGVFIGIHGRRALIEYLKNHYGIIIPDDEKDNGVAPRGV